MSSAPSPATTPPPSPPNSTTTSPPPIKPPSSHPPPSTNSTSPLPSSPSPPSVPPPSPTTRPTPPRSSPPHPEPSPPAPPPPRRSTPPSPHSGPPSNPSKGERESSRTPPSSDGISTEVIAGLAIGGAALLVIFTLICLFRKTKRRRNYEAAYYDPPPPPSDPKAVAPYGGHQHPPSDHGVTSLPSPTKPPSPLPPPPPPPFMSSSGGGGGPEYSDLPILLPPPPGSVLGLSRNTFTYEELARATNDFSEANLLGQGGFGYVHKGVLPSGKVVAVKQFGSGQGEREFQAEVEIISRVHHRHLVSLVGYCITRAKRLLVYEYVPNNSLEFHLHGKGRPTMEWSRRLKIAIGSAKGLSYLHEDCDPKIIHRDIKAANILMDFKFEAKVADFGLAKIAPDTNTHVSTRVMGTFGYMAPEYAASGKLTEKSDVFSFGVVLLELITGRPPVGTNNDSFVDWARPLLDRAYEQGEFEGLADTKMNNEYGREEMARMVACVAACVRHSARLRPRMSQIVRALEGNISLLDLNEGVRPGDSRVYSSYEGSTDYDSNRYSDNMKKFRKMELGTQEYNTTGELSNPTSDYGLYPSCSSSEGQTSHELGMGKIKRTGQGYSTPSFKP